MAEMGKEFKFVIPNISVKKDFFSDVSAVMSSIRSFRSGFAEMQKTIVENPAVKQLSDTIASIHKSCVFDYAEKFQNFTSSLQSILDKEWFKNLVKNVKYLDSLEQSGWPIFHLNFENAELVSNLKRDEYKTFLLNYFENSYKEKLKKSWKASQIIKDSRKPILEEALVLFEEQHYYGSCSILMFQLYGIADDIDVYTQRCPISISKEDVDGIDELYGMDQRDKNKNSEKRRLFQKLNYIQNHIGSWDRSLRYVKDFVLKSPQEDINTLSGPHRNKICHGEQTNFGTQEHALKAIFIADALIQFSNEVYSSTQDCC